MVKGPGDKIEKQDYDSIEEYIADAMAEGYTIEAEDFEGRPCSFCGELLDFAVWMRDPDAVVTWDIRSHDPDEPEPEPYYFRYYYCSTECRTDAETVIVEQGSYEEFGEPDHIHKDELEGFA